MKQNLEQKKGEQKKENVVGKVVGTFFCGNYKEFKRRVRASLENNEFIPGSAAFLRSVFEQTHLSAMEFNECQRAIRMEIGALKKEEKKRAEAETEESSIIKNKAGEETSMIESITKAKKQDKIITDEIRERIMRGAIEKEKEESDYIETNNLDNPNF